MDRIKKIATSILLVPLIAVFSYFFTSYLVSLYSGAGNEKLFENTIFFIFVSIALQVVTFSGIVYALYIMTRGSKLRMYLAMSFIVISIIFHVYTSNDFTDNQTVDEPAVQLSEKQDTQNCGYKTIKTSGASMVQYGIPADTTELTINTCEWCEPGDICAFICKSVKCFSESLKEKGEANDGRVGYNKLLKSKNDMGTKLHKDDCYWFEGSDPYTVDGVEYVSTDSLQYGWLCGDELEIAGTVVLPD